MSGISARRRSSHGSALAAPSEQRRSSVPSSARSLKPGEERKARRTSDVALADREKQHYDILRRRISDFVGHTAYEEKIMTKTGDGDGSEDESKPDNFAVNYLKGKKQLSEGSHDKMYKWMGYSSEEAMQQKSGKKKLSIPSDDTPPRKSSGGSGPSGGKSGGSSLGPPGGNSSDDRRRRSSTGTAPRKLSNT